MCTHICIAKTVKVWVPSLQTTPLLLLEYVSENHKDLWVSVHLSAGKGGWGFHTDATFAFFSCSLPKPLPLSSSSDSFYRKHLYNKTQQNDSRSNTRHVTLKWTWNTQIHEDGNNRYTQIQLRKHEWHKCWQWSQKYRDNFKAHRHAGQIYWTFQTPVSYEFRKEDTQCTLMSI